MKEILKYIGLTLIFFMVYSCSGGEDILQEGPEEDPFKDYCLVTIEHSGKSFGFLEFTGSKLSGNIQWGDDKSEMFAGKNTPSHVYQTAEEHIIVIKVQQADGIMLPSIEGVSRINLSDFYKLSSLLLYPGTVPGDNPKFLLSRPAFPYIHFQKEHTSERPLNC